MNPDANIVSTLFANTVKSHDAENGTEVMTSTFFLPNFIAMPPNIAPNRAPRSERLATHEACCCVTKKAPLKFPVCRAYCCFSWIDAMAGEL